MKNIFFDLDGTLLDSSDRLYNLFIDLIPECKLSKHEYWQLKRSKIDHKQIIEMYFKNHFFEEFNQEWLKLIESDKYLMFDKLYPDAVYLLQKLQKFNNLYLVTARQSTEQLLFELRRFNIENYFTNILVTNHKFSKKDLISPYYKSEDIFISDTGSDINIGCELGMRTIAVTYGFLSRESLENYTPTYLVDSIQEILQLFVYL